MATVRSGGDRRKGISRRRWIRANLGTLDRLDCGHVEIRDFIRAADYSPAHGADLLDELQAIATSAQRILEILWNAAVRIGGSNKAPHVVMRELFARIGNVGSMHSASSPAADDSRWQDATCDDQADADAISAAHAAAWRIVEVFHAKRGASVWLVVAPFMSRARWEAELARCKRLDGWYSRAWREQPGGFMFTSPAAAAEFAGERLADRTVA